jgi:hypothetical protein
VSFGEFIKIHSCNGYENLALESVRLIRNAEE